mgnify:CR=1 FL=1
MSSSTPSDGSWAPTFANIIDITLSIGQQRIYILDQRLLRVLDLTTNSVYTLAGSLVSVSTIDGFWTSGRFSTTTSIAYNIVND